MTNVEIRAAVITVSDTRDEKTDVSGTVLAELLISAAAEVVEKIIVTDDFDGLRQTLYVLTEREEINLIITTGGTGFAERDNTPEATRAVILKEAPGIAEAIRRETSKVNPKAVLSRGVCGIRNGTLIINLPGSERGVRECFEVIRPILQHAVNLISGETRH
ncbi:MAG: MogA/MoaB family molybdenum cofactor biosynthesis protein [Acidobacteria bacterium]|nr:MogA/MoaB family molybdenum cofactor biosynthesis protein [Acidobacteriota bacterium]MBK8811384.1 MogA/MoaB family molybdenum cofactor biosynthesis protein [Acidobacteriota bacterium]